MYINSSVLSKNTYNDVRHHHYKIKIYNSLVSMALGKAIRERKSIVNHSQT